MASSYELARESQLTVPPNGAGVEKNERTEENERTERTMRTRVLGVGGSDLLL